MKTSWLILSLCATAVFARAVKIVYPWNATTAIVKAGETFEVWLDADAGQRVESAVLRTELHSVLPTDVETVNGEWIYDETSGNTFDTRVTIHVPRDAPADRYDLYLITSSGDEISRKSVRVVLEYPERIAIMHFSDTHMCHGGKLVNGHPKRLLKISALADIGNLIGTDLVFITGDVIDNTLLPPKERAEFFYAGAPRSGMKGVHGFDAPTFAMPGNHDFLEGEQPGTGRYAEKAIFWNEYHGLQHHRFAFGDARFMIMNTGWHGFDWAAQRADHLAWLDRVGRGNFRAAAYHKSSMGTMGVFANDADLGLAMIGHNHHLAPNNPYVLGGRPIQYYANAVREHFNFNLFFVAEDGTYAARNNISVVENPDDPPAKWNPNLSIEFAEANDGTRPENSARIVNRYDFDIPGARVRFLVPKGVEYVIDAGRIEQAFDGDDVRVIDARVPVVGRSEQVVRISPKR